MAAGEPSAGGKTLLDHLLDRYGRRRPGHAGWVLLASFGALGLAWVLPSPDPQVHAGVPGLWAAALALAFAGGSARWSARLMAPLLAVALALGSAVGLLWWVAGGWATAGVAAAALGVGRLGGGPGILTTGPLWLAARMSSGPRRSG